MLIDLLFAEWPQKSLQLRRASNELLQRLPPSKKKTELPYFLHMTKMHKVHKRQQPTQHTQVVDGNGP